MNSSACVPLQLVSLVIVFCIEKELFDYNLRRLQFKDGRQCLAGFVRADERPFAQIQLQKRASASHGRRADQWSKL